MMNCACFISVSQQKAHLRDKCISNSDVVMCKRHLFN